MLKNMENGKKIKENMEKCNKFYKNVWKSLKT